MLVITRTLAFVLRIAFFVLGIGGLGVELRKDGGGIRSHILVFASMACLIAAEGLTSLDMTHVALLSVVLVVLAIGTVIFGRLTGDGPNLMLPVALLASVGAAVSPYAMWSGFPKHCAFIVAGVVIAIIVMQSLRGHVNAVASHYRVFLVLAVILTALPIVFGVGGEVHGASLWVPIPVIGGFQPSELAKLFLTIGLAGYCSANARRLESGRLRGLFPLLCAFGAALLIEVLLHDLGSAVLLFAATAAVVLAVSGRRGILYTAVAVTLLSVILVIGYLSLPYVQSRFDSWLDPAAHEELGAGFHLLRAEEAIRNGGILGTGLGLGASHYPVDKYPTYIEKIALPVPGSDSIYAVITEELGLMGAAVVLLSIGTILVTLARIMKNLPPRSFESNLIATALAFIVFQAFIIIGGLVRLIPLTGVTLPFVSSGGTSLIVSFALIGLCGMCCSGPKVAERTYTFSTLYLPILLGASLIACFAFTIMRMDGIRAMGKSDVAVSAGAVKTSDGVVLAHTVSEQGTTRRSYPEHTLAAHVLGKGRERSLDAALTDNGVEPIITDKAFVDQHRNPLLSLLGIPQVLPDTVLTLDSEVQRVAEAELEGVRAGAIVVIDNEDGSILAEASYPTYDLEMYSSLELQNRLGTDDGMYDELMRQLNDSSTEGFLVDRVRNAYYEPGSTFKIVTAAAAIKHGVAHADTILPGDTLTLPGGTVIENFEDQNHGDISMSEALYCSANTAFADLSLRLGSDVLKEQAEAFGFNRAEKGSILASLPSVFVDCTTEHSLAWAAFGQPYTPNTVGAKEEGPRATVLEMARVIGCVAADGKLVDTHVIREGAAKALEANDENAAGEAVLAPEVCDELKAMLRHSSHVEAVDCEVLGKTGTAEHGNGNLCWYVCSAKGVSVAVCIEADKGQTGGGIAIPKAKAVLGAAVGFEFVS